MSENKVTRPRRIDSKKPICPNCGKPMEIGRVWASILVGACLPVLLWKGSQNHRTVEIWGESISGARCKECGIVLAHFVAKKEREFQRSIRWWNNVEF